MPDTLDPQPTPESPEKPTEVAREQPFSPPPMPADPGVKRPSTMPQGAPRAWLFKGQGRITILQPRSALVKIADYLRTGLGASKQERIALSRILDSMIDRTVELQRIYDRTVSQAMEEDPVENPHRVVGGNGFFIRWELIQEIDVMYCLDLVSRKTPYPASYIFRQAKEGVQVTEIMHPRIDMLGGVCGGLFTCVIRLGAVVSLKPGQGPVDSDDGPIKDSLDVGRSQGEIGVGGVEVGPDPHK